jgi:hypothetical protein
MRSFHRQIIALGFLLYHLGTYTHVPRPPGERAAFYRAFHRHLAT